jgi:enoyl-CoA hydratase
MTSWSIEAGVMELRLEQAPINEIGSEMLERLEAFLADVVRSGPAAVLVYSGVARGFCAGADLRGLHAALAQQRATDGAGLGLGHERALFSELGLFIDRVHAVMNRLDSLPIPTVGAVSGVCFGGGFELALTLDVLVADVSARFCFPELRLGLIPGFGGIPRLLREVPNGVARDLLLTGRSIGAAKAGALGFVSQVVPRGEAVNVARETARQGARFRKPVVAVAKSLAKPAIAAAQLALEKRHFLELFAEPEVFAALGRFVRSKEKMPYLPAAEES